MFAFPDIKLTRATSGTLHLRVALQAQVRIALDQQLSIDRTVRTVTNNAAFAHRFVLERERARLLAVTLGATFVEPRHRKSTGRFENVEAVWVVALDAVDPAFDDRVVLGQAEFGVSFEMALEAGARVLPGIHNELPAASARRDMFAAGAVTGFAPALPCHRLMPATNPRVWTRRECPHIIGVTLETGVVAGVACAWNLRRREDGSRNGRAGVEQRDCDQNQPGKNNSAQPGIHRQPSAREK